MTLPRDSVFALVLSLYFPAAHADGTPPPSGTDPGRAIAAMSPPTYVLNPRFEQLMPNEEALKTQIRDGIIFYQGKYAKASGQALRGTHAKGLCVRGETEIFDLKSTLPAIAPRLAKGMFSVPGKYPTQLRFANGDGKGNPDHDPDVRAVSFSMRMPPSLSNPHGLMDFAMNDAPTFPINDAQVFADLMQLGQFGSAALFKNVGFSRWTMAVQASTVHGAAQKHPATKAYQTTRYFSTVPFALGDDEAVKYSLKPCPSNPSKALTSAPNTLSEELVRHVNEDSAMACFEVQVQLLEPDKMPLNTGETMPASFWVENALMEWPEVQAPFHTVGRVTLLPHSVVEPAACESWHIDVAANNNQIHHGLGSINRARAMAEQSSAQIRLQNQSQAAK